jgi:phosphatidylglycerol:prolipoprotein diacylglycerol transferase
MSRNFGIDIPAGVNPFEVAAVHPTQIYEVTLAVGMFFILWRLRNHLHAEGWLFGVYCVLAGMERFVIEFFRAKDDADRILGAFSIAQGIAFAFVVAGITFLVSRATTGPGKPGVMAG